MQVLFALNHILLLLYFPSQNSYPDFHPSSLFCILEKCKFSLRICSQCYYKDHFPIHLVFSTISLHSSSPGSVFIITSNISPSWPTSSNLSSLIQHQGVDSYLRSAYVTNAHYPLIKFSYTPLYANPLTIQKTVLIYKSKECLSTKVRQLKNRLIFYRSWCYFQSCH